MASQELPIRKLQLISYLQPRVNISRETWKDYSDDMKDGALFPPITVFHLQAGKSPEGMTFPEGFYVVDGFHRIDAAQSIGAERILCEVVEDKTIRDALEFSVSANLGQNGLRWNNADKRHAVERVLADIELREKYKTDKDLALLCGCGETLVRNMRHPHGAEEVQTTGESAKGGRKVAGLTATRSATRKQAKPKLSKEEYARKKVEAQQMLADTPNKSNVEIGIGLGISKDFVRNIRGPQRKKTDTKVQLKEPTCKEILAVLKMDYPEVYEKIVAKLKKMK